VAKVPATVEQFLLHPPNKMDSLASNGTGPLYKCLQLTWLDVYGSGRWIQVQWPEQHINSDIMWKNSTKLPQQPTHGGTSGYAFPL